MVYDSSIDKSKKIQMVIDFEYLDGTYLLNTNDFSLSPYKVTDKHLIGNLYSLYFLSYDILYQLEIEYDDIFYKTSLKIL